MFKRIYIEITNVCNLECSFCEKSIREPKMMTKEEYKVILDKIKGHTKYVYLHIKGEPLMHPQLRDILELSRGKVKVNITTNGTLISKCHDLLIEYSDCINVINISVHSNESINYLNSINEFTREISSRKLFYINLRFWIVKAHKLKEMFEENEYVHFSFDEEFDWPKISDVRNDRGTCYGTRAHIGILSNGDVVPCCLDHNGAIKLGNIFDDSLENILKSPRFLKMKQGFQNNKIVEDLCKSCTYRSRFNG